MSYGSLAFQASNAWFLGPQPLRLTHLHPIVSLCSATHERTSTLWKQSSRSPWCAYTWCQLMMWVQFSYGHPHRKLPLALTTPLLQGTFPDHSPPLLYIYHHTRHYLTPPSNSIALCSSHIRPFVHESQLETCITALLQPWPPVFVLMLPIFFSYWH